MLSKNLLSAMAGSSLSSKVTLVQTIFVDIANRETQYSLPNDSDIDWSKTTVEFIPNTGNAAAHGSAEYAIGLSGRYLNGTTTSYYFPTDRKYYGGINNSYVEMTINNGTSNSVYLRQVSYTGSGALILREYDWDVTVYGWGNVYGSGTLSLSTAIDDIDNVFVHVDHYKGRTGNANAALWSSGGGIFKFPEGISYNTAISSSNYQLCAGTTALSSSMYPAFYHLASSTSCNYSDGNAVGNTYATIFAFN